MKNNIRSLRQCILYWIPVSEFVIFVIVSYYLGSFQEKDATFFWTIIKYYAVGGLIGWGVFSFIWLIFSGVLIKLFLRIFLNKEEKLYKDKGFQKQLKYYIFHLFFLFSPIGLFGFFSLLLSVFEIKDIIGAPRYNYIKNYLKKYEKEMAEHRP